MRATYVFGIDRNGNLPSGPFPGRPNIKFDATVAIKIVPGQTSTVTVTDIANKTSTIVQDPALDFATIAKHEKLADRHVRFGPASLSVAAGH